MKAKIMRVTAQEEYGLRCLLQLARHAGSPIPLTVGSIARREGISAAYAEKLLRLLSRARLATSIRGMRGGYRITREPQEVTLGEALRALGGCPAPLELCGRFTGNGSRCVHTEDCGLRPVWTAVARQIDRVLDRITLSSLLASEATVELRVQRALGASLARGDGPNGGSG